MDIENMILTEDEYAKINKKYQDLILHPHPPINLIKSIIYELGINNFGLPLSVQNQVLTDLSKALNLLLLIEPNNRDNLTFTKLNSFILLDNLCSISSILTEYNLKSPYQILYLKSNKFILQSMDKIIKFYLNKN